MSQTPQNGDAPQSAAAKLFDIRLMIGGLFIVYGVLLTGAGFFTSDKELAKAADLNINLWLGIGMLVLGVLFLVWRALNPQHIAPPDEDDPAAASSNGTEAGHGH
jgi:hypothetical protein